MIRRLLPILLLACIFISGCGRYRGKWGYIDRDGRMVIKPQYSQAHFFHNGLAAVDGFDRDRDATDENIFHVTSHIDKSGRTVIRQTEVLAPYLGPGSKNNTDKSDKRTDKTPHTPYYEGLVAVNIKGRLGYVDKHGKVVIKSNPDWLDAGAFQNGRAWVKVGESDETYRYGYIDRKGNYIVKPQFASVESFSEGLAAVEVGEMEYLTYPSGKTELLRVTRSGKHGFIDTSGKMAVKPQFTYVGNFSEGLAVVRLKINGKCGYIDKSGKTILKPQWDGADSFNNGLAPVSLNGRWGMIDKSGKYVINPRYSEIGVYSEGLIVVAINGKGGYIDRSGRIVIKPRFDWADDFSEGRARVKVGKRFGFIDRNGDYIVKPRYYSAHSFSEGLAAVEL